MSNLIASQQRLRSSALQHIQTRDTAFYLYDLEGVRQRARFLTSCLAPVQIFYAMKANANPQILKALADLGLGVDVVSGPELELALKCGFNANKIVFSGVGKTTSELKLAMKHNIFQINVESVEELQRIQKLVTLDATRSEVVGPVSLSGEVLGTADRGGVQRGKASFSAASSAKSSRVQEGHMSQGRALNNAIVRIGVRVNPDIDAGTHHHISTGRKDDKFGLDIQSLDRIKKLLPSMNRHEVTEPAEAARCLGRLSPNSNNHVVKIQWVGLSVHIGSQIFNSQIFLKSIQSVWPLCQQLQREGYDIQTFDMGGGWGLDYGKPDGDEKLMQQFAADLQAWLLNAGALKPEALKPEALKPEALKPSASHSGSSEVEGGEASVSEFSWLAEPGRILVGRFGWLVARVEYIKRTAHKNFLILNTGMHHLMRPALYGAQHRIEVLTQAGVPVRFQPEATSPSSATTTSTKINTSECTNTTTNTNMTTHASARTGASATTATELYDVVGPICESTDTLARDVRLPCLSEGDWVALQDVGAYGFVMANQYNGHPLPDEIVF